MRKQDERMETVGYNWKLEKAAEKAYIDIANKANSMYNTGSEAGNIKAWQRDVPIRQKIRSNPDSLVINEEKQARHIKDSGGYIAGRSYITVDKEQLQKIVDSYAGTGELQRDKSDRFTNKEIITIDQQIGVSVDKETGNETPTNRAYIHYSNTGTHVVPTARELK